MKTFADHVLKFNTTFLSKSIKAPEGFKIINPYIGAQKDKVKQVSLAFYTKYYNDNHLRKLILGSSAARRGSAITGIPFENAAHIQSETGIFIDEFYISKSSSVFLYDVIDKYGGCEKFYKDFYMNFVFPLGIVRLNSKGNEVNCNYYDNKKLQKCLSPYILESIQRQIAFGIDTSICYCIGSGENFKFLSKINDEYGLFDTIVPLEHPRFIMQYNSKSKDIFLKKYLNALQNN